MSDHRIREESPAVPARMGVLGTLYLLKRSTGEKIQGFPIDFERVTMGRAEDCDVRIYLPDVSKLHCEILFDLETGLATLQVHSANGVHHSEGGPMIRYRAPATITLNDQDIIKLHKKIFRFEYGHPEPSTEMVQSPEVQTVGLPDTTNHTAAQSPSKDSQSTRRRASHRMSLVPAGRTFVPMSSPAKSRRHSTLGLGSGVRRATGKSGLAREVQIEEDEQDPQEEEGQEVVIDVVEGDDGDIVYLESKEDDMKEKPVPIYNRAFSTPQQISKFPMRNTSAVPRTRKFAPTQTPQHDEDIAMKDSDNVDDNVVAPEQGVLPTSPHSTPATPTPASAERLTSTPQKPLITLQVTSQVANLTPRGPSSLRKAILLRSARNVWEQSKSAGVDGAIEDGSVEVRRKSLTPTKLVGAEMIALPSPDGTIYDEEEGEGEGEGREELQWLHEDGRAEVSFESESDDLELIDADVSLEAAGPMLHEHIDEVYNVHHDDMEEVGEDEMSDGDQEINEEEEEEDEGVSQNRSYDEDMLEAEEYEINELPSTEHSSAYDAEEAENESAMTSQMGTPSMTHTIGNRFFTPQPQRIMTKQPRRSLANIGGPPVRFNRLPATPSGTVVMSAPAPPGTLGKPSRRLTIAVQEEMENDSEAEQNPETPERVENREELLAAVKRRRESLATPRALPAPPSSFKIPIRDTTIQTPHPALLPTSPDPGEDEDEVPQTPMDALKARLNTMRRQSIQRQHSNGIPSTPLGAGDRRATVGFTLPVTPATRPFGQSASFTGLASRRFAPLPPKTPIFPKLENGDGGSERPSTAGLQDILPQRSAPQSTPRGHGTGNRLNEEEEEVKDAQTPVQSITTPQLPLTGLKNMLNPKLPMKTPNFSGIRQMYPSTPVVQASPSLQGVKTLFAVPIVPPTPAYSGVAEMFEYPSKDEVVDEVQLPELGESTKSKSGGSRWNSSASRSKRAQTQPRPIELEVTEREVEEPIPVTKGVRRGKASSSQTIVVDAVPEPVSAIPVKKTAARSKQPSVTQATEDIIVSKSATARKTVSAPSRSRRTVSVEAESVPVVKATKPRTTRKASVPVEADNSVIIIPEPEEEAEAEITVVKKTTRGRSAPSRSVIPRIKEEEVAVVEKHKAKPRGKAGKVLGESEEQPAVSTDEVIDGPKTTGTSQRKTTKAAPKAKSTSTETVEKVSAPRRGRPAATKIVDKENADPVEAEVKVVAKKRVGTGTGKSAVSVEGTTTRATRSRK